jgi:hypothetical protein
MQWPLTSQLHGSVSQRQQLFFLLRIKLHAQAGTDVKIKKKIKILSPNIWREKLAFLTQSTGSLFKTRIIMLVFKEKKTENWQITIITLTPGTGQYQRNLETGAFSLSERDKDKRVRS